MSLADWIVPDWPVHSRVRAFVTTRAGGVSEGEYASMNLGAHCGDAPDKVAANRAIVRRHLPADPLYLAQVHGADVVDAAASGERPRADAAIAKEAGRVCVVLTADCMPVFLADAQGNAVGVAHAGWRGLAAGVLESTVAALGAPPAQVHAWMGPAIGPDAFEVGPEVRDAFLGLDPQAEAAFRGHRAGRYMADLYILARRRLAKAGVASVQGGGFCTFHERERFFSYRREKASGRMGAFIWLER